MRFLLVPFATLGLLAAPGTPAAARIAVAHQQSPTAATLANRYIAWRGGAKFRQLQTSYVVADAELEGLKGVTREWRTREGRERDELDLGLIKQISVDDGRSAWKKDDHLVSQASHYDVLDARRAAEVEFGAALVGGAGVTRQLAGLEEKDGRSWAVLRVGFGDADHYDLLIDPATGELHARRYVIDGRPQFVRYSDWRFVQGVRMPFVRELYGPDGDRNGILRTRFVALNRRFPAALFAKPRQERTVRFAGNAHSTGPIKYNPYTGTRIYIPATVNGHPTQILLDSGSDETVLDKSFAQTIGLGLAGKSVATGAAGSQESSYASGVDIKIGKLDLRLDHVAVTDLAEVAKRIATPLPVVIGSEIFLQTVVDIDPSGPTINFHDPNGFRAPPGAVMVPLEPSGSLRVVPVSVEGLPSAPMIFDLGNGGYMLLNPGYWQGHHLLEGRRSSTISAGAVGGEQIDRVASLKSVRFAGHTFTDVPADFISPHAGIEGDRQAGDIGMPLLGRFRMLIDFQNNRLFVVPLPKRIDEPFPRLRSGLRLVQDGNKLIVKYVSVGSPAEAEGFKPGDAIVAIDGQPIGPDYVTSPLGQWARRPAGTVVTLTMADGTTRKLTLADYF